MAGEASIDELRELEKLMEENEEWKRVAEQLLMDQPGIADENLREADLAFTAHTSKMQQLIGGQPGKLRSMQVKGTAVKWIPRIAAIFMVIGAAAAIYVFKRPGKLKKVTAAADTAILSTKKGSTTQAQLPDGTMVWLNAASAISYSKDFGKRRELTLSGEAFFDVTRDSTRPFIVQTKYLTIKAVGTAFNVMSYFEDNRDEVSLIRGEVEVNYPGFSLVLKPDERFSFTTESPPSDSESRQLGVYLGLSYPTQDLTTEQRERMEFSGNAEGVYVSAVAWDGAARIAGLQTGDWVTKINEVEVKTGEELNSVITRFKAGDKIRVTYKRNGRELTTELTLKNSPGDYSGPILRLIKMSRNSFARSHRTKDDSTICETAWLQNKIAFCGESFERVARTLERRFDVTIRFANKEAKRYTAFGLFEKQTITQILDDLRQGFDFNYKIEGNVITIE